MSNSKIRMLPLEKNSVSKSNFAELRFKIKIVLKLFIDIRDRVIYTHRKWEREREGGVLCTNSLPKWPEQPQFGWCEVRSLFCFPMWVQGLDHSGCFLLLPRFQLGGEL